ncbi:hypothetical protein LA080_008544 [Diaporthe eres]|nr:hypothetical protein LA080_008544 [Diaporthe eres]
MTLLPFPSKSFTSSLVTINTGWQRVQQHHPTNQASSPSSNLKHNTKQSLQVSTTVSEMAHAGVTLLHRVLNVPYLSPLRDLELVRALQPLVQNISQSHRQSSRPRFRIPHDY